MADKPTLTILGSTQKYNASTLNANFNVLKDAFALVLGLGGDSESDNQITGDVDFNGNTLKNVVLLDPAIIGTLNGVFFRSAWVTATAYETNDLVTESGNVYITIVDHTSGTFATDLSASKWELFASKGDTGAGSGDLLAANDLSDLDSAATARTNLDVIENVLTTRGDMVVRNATVAARLALGAVGTFLGSDGTDLVYASIGLPRGYQDGGLLANGDGAGTGDLTNDITIFEGAWRNSANDGDMLFSDIGKRLDAEWATGGTPSTPTGGLSSSLTLTNDTWYHVHLILVSGTVEVGFDTSLTAANLVTDHSATKFRRVGSVRRETAANKRFTQHGGGVVWADPPLDVDVLSQGTTPVSYSLTVPNDIQVIAHITIKSDGGVAHDLYISSPDANDEAPSSSVAPLATAASNDTRESLSLRTNTSGQIRGRSTAANVDLKIVTNSYIDQRGKDA